MASENGAQKTTYNFLGKEISGRFTIPSGIIITKAETILKISREIPQIGIITTKSIGPEERSGYREPILHQYAPGCFVNAVGLANPGAENFARQLREIKPKIPESRFLLVSIFGSGAEDFVRISKLLEPYADGFELNLSCPHAKGYGMCLGQDQEIVKEIINAVKNAVDVPVVLKLTPNTGNIGEIAKASIEAGADAICAVNTVGPGYYTFEGMPILSNKFGGISGKGILPIGLKCVKEISSQAKGKVPIIGCGGISSARDIREYEKSGAGFFGIGSALAGMKTEEIRKYFSEIESDLKSGTNNAEKMLKKVDMNFRKYRLVENQKLAEDLSVIVFDEGLPIRPGQFIFAWVPGYGEKPFSVLDDSPLKLAVQKRGCLTGKLNDMQKGAEIFIRGPYGNEAAASKNQKTILVGGGCGIAALYLIAKKLNTTETEFFFGARDKNHLFFIEEISKCSTLWVSTNDGSYGRKGYIGELLAERLEQLKKEGKAPNEQIAFFNCGPEPMINSVLPIEEKYALKENIHCAIDYITRCGVGICGSCASKSGKRICVDGPFLDRTETE